MDKTSWTLTLQTERLILRPQKTNDYESWYAAFSERLPQQYKYDEGQINLDGYDVTRFASICESHQKQALSDYAYIWGVFDRQTNQHLGNVDLSTIQREEKQWANLGYSIHNQHWRQRFGKEAVRAAIIAGFEQLGYHRIEAAINLDNYPSIALIQSVGLQKECVRRGFYYENAQWVDHVIYVALPADLGRVERPPAIATSHISPAD
ncbi:MAG: GNAT family N-acetyltransferase [Cyanothece sp. SIO1E1]|nr:GNAT family N-acetyltransferase [Cyanothece sp. SIO1E1]